jgi:hypothetical protein
VKLKISSLVALLDGWSPALASPDHEGVYVFSVCVFFGVACLQIDLNDLLVVGSAEHREIRVSRAVVQLRGWDLRSAPSLGRFLP